MLRTFRDDVIFEAKFVIPEAAKRLSGTYAIAVRVGPGPGQRLRRFRDGVIIEAKFVIPEAAKRLSGTYAIAVRVGPGPGQRLRRFRDDVSSLRETGMTCLLWRALNGSRH